MRGAARALFVVVADVRGPARDAVGRSRGVRGLTRSFDKSFGGLRASLRLRAVSPGSLLLRSVGFGLVCAFVRTRRGFCC